MSWTNFFPVLDDGMVDAYESEATKKERADISKMFEIESVHGVQTRKHVVATSLFLEQESVDECYSSEGPKVSKGGTSLTNLYHQDCNPLKHRVSSVIEVAEDLGRKRPEVVFRVYLAKNLEFLIPILVEAKCEVRLMKSSSLQENQKELWRFLAMEDGEMATVVDTGRIRKVLSDIERTELIAGGDLKFWRIPCYSAERAVCSEAPLSYRAISPGQLGSLVNFPIRKLAEAFIWNDHHGRLEKFGMAKSRGEQFSKSQFLHHEVAKYFLNTAIYPRMADAGILTLADRKSPRTDLWFALDIEHCMKANPNSEIVFWEDPSANHVYSFDWTKKDIERIKRSLMADDGGRGDGPLVSICVSLKNRSKVRCKDGELLLFPNCVKSLAKIAMTVGPIELVVADFASDDWPLEEWIDEAAGEMTVRVVAMDGDFSRGRGLNAAVKEAQSENLLLFDADILIEESVFIAGTECLSRAVAFFPTVMNLDEKGHKEDWIAWGLGISFLKKEAFEKAGGIPEFHSWGGEDDLFFENLLKVSKVDRMKLEGIVHQWHPVSCRHENYTKKEGEDFRTYRNHPDSRESYHDRSL